ncbi:aminopeptidase N-like [Chironomus tepperi]|uniref:aminopeptidase N-like n=1 Tax=Chironomus tepperi TaxID=113505 RepID=UPI00391F07EE
MKYEDLTFSAEESKDFLIIKLPYTMPADHQIILDILYDGSMARAKTDKLKNKGFMLGTYQDESVDSENYIFTEFEPTKARKCFPCFDEPALKSHFNLQIEHDSSYNAIANMPVISRVQSNKTINHVTTTFLETPKMSTYLFAFVISKFKHTESNEIGIPQKVYARPSLIDKGKVNFVAIHLDRMLRTAEEYFQVPYSLPKMDHVVAPNYFSAIENWGVNGYNEDYVLEAYKIETYLCFLHEIVHHYFGNLVTPKWWTHTWLKEGFAKHYEIELAKLIFPELLNEIEQYREIRYITALNADAEKHARPLNFYVETPDQISRKFFYSEITYLKASSIINMFQNAIGAGTWRKGMKYYIEKHQYSSTEPKDLYEAVQKAVDEDYPDLTFNVEAAMSSWEVQAGYPTISARLENGTLKLSQKRMANSRNNELYVIPIFYISSSDQSCSTQTAKFWMTERDVEIENFNDDWIVFNCQNVGYYDVTYDNNLWTGIINQLNKNHSVIPKSFRKTIIRTILKNSDSVFKDCDNLNNILNYF